MNYVYSLGFVLGGIFTFESKKHVNLYLFIMTYNSNHMEGSRLTEDQTRLIIVLM